MTTARPVLLALLAGMLAAGLPAAYVLAQGGAPGTAALIALLGVLPAGLALLSPPR